MKIIEGNIALQGNERIAILCSRFNSMVTDKLIEGARDSYLRHGGHDDNLTLIRVSGAFELPFMLDKILASGNKVVVTDVNNNILYFFFYISSIIITLTRDKFLDTKFSVCRPIRSSRRNTYRSYNNSSFTILNGY